MVLKAILAEFTRSGLEEATIQQTFRHIAALCTMDRLPVIKMAQVELSSLVNMPLHNIRVVVSCRPSLACIPIDFICHNELTQSPGVISF